MNMPNNAFNLDLSTMNEKQKLFFKAKQRFIAYGGARGGGKSWSVDRKAILLALRYAGIKMLLLRRTYKDLERNHARELSTLLQGFVTYNKQDKLFLFPNGSLLELGYCASESDVLQYQGQEYDIIFIDEATQFTEYQYQTLTACLRGANDFPKRMYLTCNPGGVGHEWVKRLFVSKRYKESENPNDYEFISATVFDNKVLMEKDKGYVDMLNNLSDGLSPMACLAGVLIVVSYNMAGIPSVVALTKAPKSDLIVMIVTFILTVIFDLTIAIEVGLLLAVILFLKRTNEATVIRSFSDEIDPTQQTDLRLHGDDLEKLHIPPFTEVYEIDGPYFFGIANKFDEISQRMGADGQKVRILRMRKVSFMDSTGLHNLEELFLRSQRCGMTLVLSGVNERVYKTLEKAGLVDMIGKENVRNHINGALARAEEIVKATAEK